MNWDEIFGLHSVLFEPVLRGTVMYLALFVLFRVVIRRRVGAVGMSDILLVVIIADAAQSGLSGEAKTRCSSWARSSSGTGSSTG